MDESVRITDSRIEVKLTFFLVPYVGFSFYLIPIFKLATKGNITYIIHMSDTLYNRLRYYSSHLEFDTLLFIEIKTKDGTNGFLVLEYLCGTLCLCPASNNSHPFSLPNDINIFCIKNQGNTSKIAPFIKYT